MGFPLPVLQSGCSVKAAQRRRLSLFLRTEDLGRQSLNLLFSCGSARRHAVRSAKASHQKIGPGMGTALCNKPIPRLPGSASPGPDGTSSLKHSYIFCHHDKKVLTNSGTCATIIMVKVTIIIPDREEKPMDSLPERNRLYATTDLLIMTVRSGRLLVLLSRRKSPPFAGRWALPGRFVAPGESAEETARKLLLEMLPAEGAFLEQLYTFSSVDRDPRGRVISMAYLVILPWAGLRTLLEDPECLLHPFRPDTRQDGLTLACEDGSTLRENDLAFDHARIIRTGLARLRGKIDYTDIGFSFLEDQGAFSLSELQNVFEAVLDTALDTSNFRRSVLTRYEKTGRLEQTDREEKKGRGRPAALYRLKGPQQK